MTTQSDYWCSRNLVITVEGPDSRQRVEVGKPFARLGSHDLSEVLIADKGVSRRKLYFHATDDGVFCVDLAQVDSAASRSRSWLGPDDCIRLGPYRIWAQLDPPASETRPRGEAMADLEAKGTAAEPQPVVVMSIKGKEIARRDLTRQLTVLGRRSPSTLRITSHTVSATHCVLYWQSGILWVVDLFSGNGTRLQGRPIEVAQFPPGASLKIGRAELHHVDMFEKLPDGDEVEPAETSDSAGHEGSVAQDDVDDGQGSQIDIDDSPPETAESLALASRLATQREELDGEVAAWINYRQRADAELAERTEHLAADRAELDDQEAQWEKTRQREEAGLAARKSQLDETAAALDNEKEQLDALRTQAEEGRRRTEVELADRAGQRESIEKLRAAAEIGKRAVDAELAERTEHLAADRAELDSQKNQWEETRQRKERQLASRESRLEETAAALDNEREELATLREQAEEERRKTEAALADQARERESIEPLEAEIEDRRRELERETEVRSIEQNRREAEYQRRVEELLKRQEEFLAQREDAESRQARHREEAVQSERELAEGREDLERQRSELAAARDQLRRQGEAWQSKQQDQERSLDERERQHREASTLLAADRDEFDGLREKREREHGQTNERLEELAQQLADQRADLQSRRQAWETKRQQDETAIADRSEELDEASAALTGDRERFEAKRNAREEERRRQDDERARLSKELSDNRADLERDRRDWDKNRQQDETAVADRSTKLDQASAALTGERERFEAARRAGEEKRRRIDAEQTDRSRQLAREQAEFLRQREEWASQPRRDDAESRRQPARQSPETDPPESSALSYLDGSPRLSALTTIRRGPRWLPANHTDELGRVVRGFWLWVVVAALICSVSIGAAVWFYLTPAYTITIRTGAAVNENAINRPQVDGGLGHRPPDGRSPEDIIKSDDVLSEALTRVDGVTFSEISRRGNPLAWLLDELLVSYSSETNYVRIGLRGSYVSKASRLVDAVAEAFMAKLNLPPSAVIDRRADENSYRLSLAIAGAALGMFAPILLATVWGKRRLPAGSGLPYGLA